MADVDELRRHHDDPHAPPGPHSVPRPGAAPDMPQEPVERAEPPAPPEPENASTVPPTNGSRPSGDSAAEPAPSDRFGNAQSTETTTTSPHPETGGVNRTPSLDLPDGQVPEVAAPPAAAPPDDRKSVAEGRQAVLAAFAQKPDTAFAADATPSTAATASPAPGRARARYEPGGVGGNHLWVRNRDGQLEHAPPWSSPR